MCAINCRITIIPLVKMYYFFLGLLLLQLVEILLFQHRIRTRIQEPRWTTYLQGICLLHSYLTDGATTFHSLFIGCVVLLFWWYIFKCLDCFPIRRDYSYWGVLFDKIITIGFYYFLFFLIFVFIDILKKHFKCGYGTYYILS